MSLDDLDDFAKEFAGNWQKFSYYGPSALVSQMPDGHLYGIWYGWNEADDDCLNECNYNHIVKELKRYINKTVFEICDRHWCGGIRMYGLFVKVYNKNGTHTAAYKIFHDLLERMKDYPILDEEAYWQMEEEIGWSKLHDAVDWILGRIDDNFDNLHDSLKKILIEHTANEFAEEYQQRSSISELAHYFPDDEFTKFIEKKFDYKFEKK